MPARQVLVVAATCALPLAAPAWGTGAETPAASEAGWTFRVLLDGKPIGEHRFRAGAPDVAGERTMVSEASFAVRLLGITVYRYQHRAVERWRGDCLVALSADTDDNGQRMRVSALAQGSAFEVSLPAAQSASGCVMSFAYWHPALRAQQRLLNAQTGRIEPVRIASLGEASLEVGTRRVNASGWRISGPARPIDVWYSPQGDWVGLDTRVDGGRTLSYRRF
ncbi:MAG: hypothetical protein KIT60_03350 [Burkholderiaceae bacterium]|nr:hypothetical protein [Burkholderiaceae bacterium]